MWVKLHPGEGKGPVEEEDVGCKASLVWTSLFMNPLGVTAGDDTEFAPVGYIRKWDSRKMRSIHYTWTPLSVFPELYKLSHFSLRNFAQ